MFPVCHQGDSTSYPTLPVHHHTQRKAEGRERLQWVPEGWRPAVAVRAAAALAAVWPPTQTLGWLKLSGPGLLVAPSSGGLWEGIHLLWARSEVCVGISEGTWVLRDGRAGITLYRAIPIP